MSLQSEYIGCGKIEALEKILTDNASAKVLLVTGRASFESSGAERAISPYLSGLHVTRFSDFEVNPQFEDAIRGVNIVRKENCDLVIAIGGGSCLDMGKLINILAAQEAEDLSEVVRDGSLIDKPGRPFVAIPTTAGTGSEATHFAVAYINKVKYSLAHRFIMPDYAIVDSQLCHNLPSYITACSGLDALSQATESYWAVGATVESKRYARRAIELIRNSLVMAVTKRDIGAIDAMAKGANLAGKAINISKTTAAHAISYPITTLYQVPHGHAVALTLGKFFELNADVNIDNVQDKRGVDYSIETMSELYELYECDSAEGCCNAWYQLVEELGLETKAHAIGVKSEADKQRIVEQVNLERLGNNPVRLSSASLMKVL